MDLYRHARDFPRTLQGAAVVVGPADLVRHGVSIEAARWRADHGGLVRAQQGIYLLGTREPDLLDRVHAALAVAPAGAVVGHHTAAALQGFGVVSTDDVHLVVHLGSCFPNRKGIRVHQTALPWGRAVASCGVPCTPAARTAVDLARTLPRPQGLSSLDAALFAEACTDDDLLAEVARHESLAGVRRARALVAMADPRPQCVQESHLRLHIYDAGLTDFQPQIAVCDEFGELRYRLDLGDPRRRVAAEYDGKSHLDRLPEDRRRHNWLSDRGWEMRYFTKDDLYRWPRTIVPTLLQAMSGR
jgi:very-short-patch-repair endonuclease